MDVEIKKSSLSKSQEPIAITGSKSESNRLLILQALYPNLKIANLSSSDDSVVMQKALRNSTKEVDIHHAGTAMRFLTAYFAVKTNDEVILTGSERMQERPIKILVDALKSLGADITYLKNEGFPPIKIKGVLISKNDVALNANVSSQYISALMLIAPAFNNGLKISLKGEITSRPYISMTLSLLNELGIETSFKENIIVVNGKPSIKEKKIFVESDWSSASYYFSFVALSPIGTKVKISSFKEDSFQGDSILTNIYKEFGVNATFKNDYLLIEKTQIPKKGIFEYDLINAPDIAQTIAVTCFGLGKKCELKGLHTLKIKETDRLVALKQELEKLGAQIIISESSLSLSASNSINKGVSIETYNDHRMAMAFAPLCLLTDIIIKDSKVVSKSYPDFWNHLKTLGLKVSK